MKVYISNYRNHWFSPYRIAEKLCFWREIDYDEPWVKRFHAIAEPVMSMIRRILDTLHPSVDYVKIDRWDTWSMDYTLGTIILPMLKQLKATKHGYPAKLTAQKWDAILDKMIWSFEQVVGFYPDDQFWLVQPVIDWEAPQTPDENGLRKIKWIEKGKLDKRSYNRYHKQVNEGLALFGKHYRDLWD
jgi:hypothetical protein